MYHLKICTYKGEKTLNPKDNLSKKKNLELVNKYEMVAQLY